MKMKLLGPPEGVALSGKAISVEMAALADSLFFYSNRLAGSDGVTPVQDRLSSLAEQVSMRANQDG